MQQQQGFWIHENETNVDFGLSPVSQMAKNIEYTFALLKLAKAGYSSNIAANINTLTQHFAKNLQQFTNAENDIDKLVDFYKKLGGYQLLDGDNFEVRYKHLYNSANILYELLYDHIEVDDEDLYRKICRVNASSIESSYTNSCVNVTVLELQSLYECAPSRVIKYRNSVTRGKGIKCKQSDSKFPELEWQPLFLRDDYLICALENIAEFKIHYKPISKANKFNKYTNYISYLKYILRVSFSITRYNNYDTGKYKQDKYAKLYRICCKLIVFKNYTVNDIETQLNELDGYLKAIQKSFKLSNMFNLQQLSNIIIKEINTLCISAGYTFHYEGLSVKSKNIKTKRASRNKKWTTKTLKNK